MLEWSEYNNMYSRNGVDNVANVMSIFTIARLSKPTGTEPIT